MRELVSFALIDGAKYQQHAASMGVTAYPALLLLEESTGTKFMLSGADLTTAGMQRFFDDWNAKPRRVRPFVRSLPEPPTNHAPVHVITGNSYEATVSDERLNVLVNLFAPWCGTPMAPTLGCFVACVRACVCGFIRMSVLMSVLIVSWCNGINAVISLTCDFSAFLSISFLHYASPGHCKSVR